MRADGRRANQLRPVAITRNYIKHAEGSVLIEVGDTRVICTATVEERVPPFLRNSGQGWITAEYAMLPRSSQHRIVREAARGKIGGRTHEIQRLVGRSLRAVVDLKALGDRTIWIDCDVIQADGGTRTASITGACVALWEALLHLQRQRQLKTIPLTAWVAAVSVGLVEGRPLLDLTYQEDSRAEVDMNLVLTEAGHIVEIQGTAEVSPFTQQQLERLLTLGRKGVRELIKVQRRVVGKG